MASISINGDTSGSITVTAPTVAGTNTLTLPALTQTVNVMGPAFSAYQSSAQSALSAGIKTKISLQSEEFDTANCFDTSLYRFTPNVAGYYQINGGLGINGVTTSVVASIYKNGTPYKDGTYVATNSTSPVSSVGSIVYLNGTTDYVELWGLTGTSLQPFALATGTYFNGCFLRGA